MIHLLCIASPAASPARRTWELRSRAGTALGKGLPAGTRVARPCKCGPGVAGLAGFGRAWGSPPTIDSGPGGTRRGGGVTRAARRDQRGALRIVPTLP